MRKFPVRNVAHSRNAQIPGTCCFVRLLKQRVNRNLYLCIKPEKAWDRKKAGQNVRWRVTCTCVLHFGGSAEQQRVTQGAQAQKGLLIEVLERMESIEGDFWYSFVGLCSCSRVLSCSYVGRVRPGRTKTRSKVAGERIRHEYTFT